MIPLNAAFGLKSSTETDWGKFIFFAFKYAFGENTTVIPYKDLFLLHQHLMIFHCYQILHIDSIYDFSLLSNFAY